MNEHLTVEAVDASIQAAEFNWPRYLPNVPGFTSGRVRRLLNNLCSLPNVTYLEIGCHVGCTLTGALYGHTQTRAVAIDNWSLFPEQGADLERQFRRNVATHLDAAYLTVFGQDAWTVDPGGLPKIDVYFYDGAHDRESHRRALTHFASAFADRMLYICDDWRWQEVRDGTADGLSVIPFDAVRIWELPADYERDVEKWWNILGLYLLERRA